MAKKLTLADKLLKKATITLTCEPEEDSVFGHFASDDTAADREMEARIAERANNGDVWAWCFVIVKATVEYEGVTYEGTDTLGCCSYEDEDEFKRCGYYEDMVKQAKDALRADIERCARWKKRPLTTNIQELELMAPRVGGTPAWILRAEVTKTTYRIVGIDGHVLAHGHGENLDETKHAAEQRLRGVLFELSAQIR